MQYQDRAVQEVPLACWPEFEAKIQELFGPTDSVSDEPLFRGMASSCWGLDTAFFAFDDVPRGSKRVCVYALKRERFTTGSADEHCFSVGPYMRTHPRHFLQQCRYSMCVKQGQDDYAFLPHYPAIWNAVGPEGQVYKFTFSTSERQTALTNLDQMNINPYSLYGSEDGLVRTIARRECDFKSWDV